MKDRPNFLWLTYEDTSPQFVSCYGHTPVATTPFIDTMASEGVLFTNAYATAPVCSASRSALITGVCNEATGLGHHRSKYPMPRDTIKGFPYYLQQAGYYTTNNVKTDYNIEDEQDFISETWDESSSSAHWRNRGHNQPFFSVFNYMDSHQSRTMTKPWGWYEEHVLSRLDGDEVVSPDQISVPPIYRDTPEMRKHLSRVYNALKLCDKRIAACLAELQDDGLDENTIVFCFADHGEGIPRGKCNGIGFGYRASFVMRFPEKYKHLSPWGAGTITDELISFEDLAPTLLALAGCPVPAYCTGRVLLGDRRSPPPTYVFAARNRLDDTPDLCRSAMDGRFVYTRNYFPHLPVVKYQKYSDVGDILRCIRREYARGELNEVQGELVKPTRPTEYLYDLDADPWEVNNVAGDSAYKEHLIRLRQATIRRSVEMGDVMFLPERAMVGTLNGSTPYQLRFDKTYNPLREMLDAAALVGDIDSIPKQIELLGHQNENVRYWAAVGLFALRDRIADVNGEIKEFLFDPSPSVQIEIAAALVGACGDEDAISVLSAFLGDRDNYLAHQAISRIMYMPEAAPRFVETMRDLGETRSETDFDGSSFPRREAEAMFRYLYMGESLYYPDDVRYIRPEARIRDW